MQTDADKIRLILALRQQGITDHDVLAVLENIPRHAFVLDAMRGQAYDDSALPIDCGQTISQPYIVALMTQLLQLEPRHKVLEIGTGSGYQAAVLSRLCRRVYSVERFRPLMQKAEQVFEKLRFHNITCRYGDGFKGWPEQAPFERIIVTAAPEQIPQALVDQLAVGGIMVIPVGPTITSQQLLKVVRTEEGIEIEQSIPVRFVPLVQGRAEETLR